MPLVSEKNDEPAFVVLKGLNMNGFMGDAMRGFMQHF